jgi:NAD(P)-dependent dehydrogenase (short-subunit alcohol dehydrogenase family)
MGTDLTPGAGWAGGLAGPGDLAAGPRAGSGASFFRDTESAFGPVEVLVNNAAIVSMAPFGEFDASEFRRIVEVNRRSEDRERNW